MTLDRGSLSQLVRQPEHRLRTSIETGALDFLTSAGRKAAGRHTRDLVDALVHAAVPAKARLLIGHGALDHGPGGRPRGLALLLDAAHHAGFTDGVDVVLETIATGRLTHQPTPPCDPVPVGLESLPDELRHLCARTLVAQPTRIGTTALKPHEGTAVVERLLGAGAIEVQPAPDVSRWRARLLRRHSLEREPVPGHPYWDDWGRLTLTDRSRPSRMANRIASFKLLVPGRWRLSGAEATTLVQRLRSTGAPSSLATLAGDLAPVSPVDVVVA